jgi:hypothetical protein
VSDLGQALATQVLTCYSRWSVPMSDQRLFDEPARVFHLGATFCEGRGWHLSVVAQRPGRSWDDSRPVTYSSLTTGELMDVIEQEVSSLLAHLYSVHD